MNARCRTDPDDLELHREALLDDALIDTFPASDPISTLCMQRSERAPWRPTGQSLLERMTS